MAHFRKLAFLAFCCFLLTACMSPKSYVDPSYPKVAYEDLSKRPEPMRLGLTVDFLRQGEPHPRANTILKDNAERILRSTGLIIPTFDQAIGNIKITVNNTGDIGQAAAKGFGTGLTLGLAGSTVMDSYEMTITISANGKTVSRTAVKHAIHTAIGNTDLPPGVEAVPPNVAFSRVLEQMIIRALKDMQQSGELAYRPIPVWAS